MAPQPPSPQEWARLSDTLGFELSPDKLAEMAALAAPTLAAYSRLDELPDETLPVRYPRTDPGHRPVGEENPHNGWAWKCSIKGADGGKLAGKRVAIKDNVAVAGVPMGNGTALLENFVPNEDATVVTRVLDAGGEIVGKTTVPAFCFDGAGITCHPGPQPTNPHDAGYCPGASSAGAGIVVVTGQADLAVGGDQGGSIRIPASWSGCYGLKPTHGLVPYTGAFPIEMTLDHLGPMARSVEGCALFLEVLAGSDGLDPRQPQVGTAEYGADLVSGMDGMRVGILSEGFGISGISEDDVDEAVREAANRFAQAGAKVESVSVPMHRDGPVLWSAIAHEGATYQMVEGDGMGTNWRGHYSTALVDAYGRARRSRARDYPDTVKLTAMVGRYMSERYNHHYYAKAQNLSRRLRAQYDQVLSAYDVLVLPTTPMKAMPLPSGSGLPELFATALGMLDNTAPFDVTGHPAMSVPCGMSNGLPVGMMIVGKHFDEATVLRAAYTFQEQLSA